MEALPYPSTLSGIERIAGTLRGKLDPEIIDNSEILRALVDRTGGKITVVDDPTDQEAAGGSLIINGEGDYTIFLSPYTSPVRDNFTIAHELGHYVLHYYPQKEKLEVPIRFTRYGTGLVEWQANRFAAALLMPAVLFKEKVKEYNRNVSLLAGHFCTSPQAVEIRMSTLKCAGTE
ncbi:MAG: ImmA/IrrE family metallo-endopeptidase [Gemmatales bacterium]